MIQTTDELIYDESLERIHKFYRKKFYRDKLIKLIDYYKYHIEIPRMFKSPTYKTLNKFHNNKRRIRYNEVINIIKDKKNVKFM